MKNLRKAVLTMMAAGMIVTAGCGKEKVAVEPEAFISAMEGAGAQVSDQTETMAEVSSATSVQVAYMEDQYQIEYYEFEEAADASYLYSASVEQLETAAETASGVAKTNVSTDSYGKYTISMNGNYIVVSRIGNTVMYATAAGDYKDTVKELLEQMGY